MGRWKEKAAQGDHETLIARVRWLWENRRKLPFDVEPGPSGQWIFGYWTSDPKVRRMSCSARGQHMDSICDAWAEHPPCSLPAHAEDLEAIFSGADPADRAAILRAWETEDGRIWQPGLCKTYLSQIELRIGRVRGGLVKAQKTKELKVLDRTWEVLTTRPPYAELMLSTCSAPAQGPSSSSSSSSSEDKKKNPPSAEPPVGGPTPSKPPKRNNPQAQKIKALEDFYHEHGAKPPEPGVLAKWMARVGGVENALLFLDDMHGKGKLGQHSFCWECSKDWQPRRGNGGKPVQGKGRFAQPHTTAPGSTGKDHGIDF